MAGVRSLGVIGYPIGHSLSPAMQRAAIEAAGLPYRYTAMEVPPEQLAETVSSLKSASFRGFNVTIPHKTAVMPLLDEIHEDARRIGAVNTVVQEKGRLIGYNTDATGFVEGLRSAGETAAHKNVVLLGAGGAARAVLWALVKEGAKKILLGVRNVENARAILRDFSFADHVAAVPWTGELFRAGLTEADLVVNATPLGMTPHTAAMPPVDWAALKTHAFLYDIIYTPERTRFLQEGEAHGHRGLNGVSMLIGQGVAAFRLWTGKEADRAAMKCAVAAELP
ncbi:MAG: shikimate dehydrogenase [Schwartzia sp. (in: firmicutes)]